MSSAADILREHRIRTPSSAPGRYYTTCPQCSAERATKEHRAAKVLGVTIEHDGVHWGCNHCGWSGGGKINGANGRARTDPFLATYDYTDESGELLFQVCRLANKQFRQRRPDGKGGWIWKTADVRKVLFRLPQVLEAIASERTIMIVEGEKDTERLWRIGIPATCNPGGASEPNKKPKWRAEYSEALRGADVVIVPDNDAAGRAHADAIARMSVGIAARIRLLELAAHWPTCPQGGDVSDWLNAGHTREELDALIERARDYAPDANERADADALRMARVADIEARAVDWLWPSRLARGKLTLIAGDPGIGKSQISIDIIARVTTGAHWPDGGVAPRGNVIMLSAEDSIADVLRPRLEVTEADLTRVHVIQAAIQDGKERSFNIAADIARLQSAVASIGDVVLITIDPVTSYMGTIDSHRTTDVRHVLEPLARLAEEASIAILAISHPPKATQAKAIHAVTGSLAFVAAARLVFVALEEPETERRLLLPVKSNLSALANGLGYRLVQSLTARDIVASRVEWDGAPVTMTANEALHAGAASSGKLAEAKELLIEELAAGPMPADFLIELAKRLEISERTLRNAKRELGIIAEKSDYRGGWIWRLPTRQ